MHPINNRISRRNQVLIHSVLAAAMGVALSAPTLAATKDWNTAGGNWNAGANWLPNGMPGSIDSVLIGTTAPAQNANVMLNVISTVASLSVTDGMTLDTNGFQLTVGTGATVSGQNSSGILLIPSRISVDSAGANNALSVAGNLSFSNGAWLSMNGGKAQVGGQLSVDVASEVYGSGIINLARNTSPAMTLDGTLSPSIGGLTINQNGTGLIDLDGGTIGDKTIAITAANVGANQYASLTINGTSLADTFDDDFKLSTNNTLNMNLSNGWTLGSGAKIEFNGRAGVSGYNKIAGGAMTVAGTFDIKSSAIAQIDSDITFNPGSVVNLAQYSYLSCSGPHVYVNGGTFTGAGADPYDTGVDFFAQTTYSGASTFTGVVRQSNDANLSDNATVNANVFDLDGLYENTHWQLSHYLTLNAQSLDTSDAADPRFNGTIDIYNGGFVTNAGLTVNLPSGQSWTIAGNLNLHGNSFFDSNTVSGSTVHIAGNLNADFRNSIGARVIFDAGSVANLDSTAHVQLAGGFSVAPNEIHGGIIAGQGTLAAASGNVLMGYGTIGCRLDFDSGTGLLASGGTLAVSGEIINMSQIGAMAGGTLNITQPLVTPPSTEIRLYGGTVTGAAIVNGGLIQGYGVLSPNSLINNTTLSAIGNGLLVIDTTSEPDLDGSNFTGVVRAQQGDLKVVDQPSPFAGQMYIGQGHHVEFSSGWSLASGGLLSMDGNNTPAFVSGTQQAIFGNISASGTTRFIINSTIGTSGTVSLPAAADTLVLEGTTFVQSGVTFSGAGKILNDVDRNLYLNSGSNVNVRLENAGKLDLANFVPAIAATKTYDQKPSGEIVIDLAGGNPGTGYDRLIVTGNATLNGKLSLVTNSFAYVPAYLVQHEILHTGGALSGRFGSVGGIAFSPTKYMAVTYDADSVFVTAALLGDANLDGSVNFDDLLALAQSYGVVGSQSWVNGDFNGNGGVTFNDLLLVSQNYGSHLLTGEQIAVDSSLNFQSDWAMAQSLVPEPAMLAFGILGAFMPMRRVRR